MPTTPGEISYQKRETEEKKIWITSVTICGPGENGGFNDLKVSSSPVKLPLWCGTERTCRLSQNISNRSANAVGQGNAALPFKI